MKITLPQTYISTRLHNNEVKQFVQEQTIETDVVPYSTNKIKGFVTDPIESENLKRILLTSKKIQPPDEFQHVLQLKYDFQPLYPPNCIRPSDLEWLKFPRAFPRDHTQYLKQILESWNDKFHYKEKKSADDTYGLRPPQIGSIHAIHAHWTGDEQPATIVMPTGTGKTETMLSILISKMCPKLLVVVPTDALRSQIGHKFLTLGILKDAKVIDESVQYPLVGILEHGLKTIPEVDDFFGQCNIIVTTMRIVSSAAPELQARMAYHCPYLFIDEAHHMGAPTWKAFGECFQNNRIVQFTATPYRNDDKPIGGKIIYTYPLRKAQEEMYFKPINFVPVFEFDPNKVDETIAQVAVDQLRLDRTQHNHILMARVGSISRAQKVFDIYSRYTEFETVQIHSQMTPKKKDKIKQRILDGKAQIVVCVDMLGEGFDMPELKIAAFHDIRKSLPTTLQLAGRFTRTRSDLGDATFIANIADVDVRGELKKLYLHDSDWNYLLQDKSEHIIQSQVNLWEFAQGFSQLQDNIPILSLRPAMSTAIYRTTCAEWAPENFKKGMRGLDSFELISYDIHLQEQLLIIITAQKTFPKWINDKNYFNFHWESLILFWDKEQQLLFINSSNNSGYYKALAEAVTSTSVEHITGDEVFRCLFGINRLQLQNVGLNEQIAKYIRYTMRAGSDIESGISETQKERVTKANVFGTGYENGERTSIGCSYKGRIWSRENDNIKAFTHWCQHIGGKILDESINPDEVLKGTLIQKPVACRPSLLPILIEWSEDIYKAPETTFNFIFTQNDIEQPEVPFYQVEIRLVEPAIDGNIQFELVTDDFVVGYKLSFITKNEIPDHEFSSIDNDSVWVEYKNNFVPATDFLYEHCPVIRFVDGSFLTGNLFTEFNKNYEPYPADQIATWNWSGIDIKKESQGVKKLSNSIQYHVIQRLRSKSNNYDIIFDDDGPGESADIVTITVIESDAEKAIQVEFYHCKYSGGSQPGARIDDLYAVCGQAQKSICWMDDPTKLFMNLLRRENKAKNDRGFSRFEKGNKDELIKIKEKSHMYATNLSIFIVQPGLSKQKVSQAQLHLLAVTENYLLETYQLPFGVIGSS